jgi:electron transfer flavoprotein alpha subunit
MAADIQVLVVAEHDNASIKPATLNTVTAALQCGAEVHVLVAGHDAGEAAKAASQIAGVAKVLHADAEGFAHGLAENVAAQVVETAKAGGYSHVLLPSTASGKNIAPRVAALLDVAQISDATAVVSADTFERPIYAGNALATVKSADAKKVMTVRATSFDPVPAEGGNATVEAAPAAADPGLSSFLGAEIVKSERPELPAARIVISGGRAMANSENFKILEAVADKLGAAVGAEIERQRPGGRGVHQAQRSRIDARQVVGEAYVREGLGAPHQHDGHALAARQGQLEGAHDLGVG